MRHRQGGDSLPYSRRDLHGPATIGIWKNDRELLTAIPRHEVARTADAAGDGGGDGVQAGIAHQVAILVVEQLEMIDVDQQHRELSVRAHRPAPFPVQHLVKAAAIRHAGQRVRRRELGQVGGGGGERQLRLLLVGNVTGVANQLARAAIGVAHQDHPGFQPCPCAIPAQVAVDLGSPLRGTRA